MTLWGEHARKAERTTDCFETQCARGPGVRASFV